MFTTLSNQLTLARLIAIPLICLCLILPGATAAWCAMLLFVAAAITDYFDGHFARTRNEGSTLGRVLDPIADKLLVVATLMILVFNGRIDGITILPALVIVMREVTVSGLREFLAELNVGLPVTRLAKWKTGVQMTAIPFVIMGLYPPILWGFETPIGIIGMALLWSAAVLTIITGWDYWLATRRHVAG